MSDVPKYLRILYRLAPTTHAAVCAAICEGCRSDLPIYCYDYTGQEPRYFHTLEGEQHPCLASAYRVAVSLERSQDFKVFERAAHDAGLC